MSSGWEDRAWDSIVSLPGESSVVKSTSMQAALTRRLFRRRWYKSVPVPGAGATTGVDIFFGSVRWSGVQVTI
jgi:hypothetical protein